MTDDLTGRARAQDVGVIDAVAAGQQRVDHGEQLAAGTVTDADQLVDQRLDTQVLAQRRGQNQPRVSDHPIAVERDLNAVQRVRRCAHPESASCQAMHFGVVTGIFPGQEAFLLELTPTSRRNAVDRGLAQ
jgi:hypothetical protein